MLQGLAEDLVNGQYADKERAVAMLSSMTMYIDHHDVLLEAGVLPALMSAVSNPKVEPTVSWAQTQPVIYGCCYLHNPSNLTDTYKLCTMTSSKQVYCAFMCVLLSPFAQHVLLQ